MAYVAVKGGQEAIEASIERLKYERVKKGISLDIDAIKAGMRGMIDQVMSEASLYDEDLAALAIKQGEGNPEEVVFLLRAFRSTLPRKYYSETIESENMSLERRISASFKDIPGGQILGAAYDYTHRLIDFNLDQESDDLLAHWLDKYNETKKVLTDETSIKLPKVMDYLRQEGIAKCHTINEDEPTDMTKTSLKFPSKRCERLQILTRGQTGAVTAFGYASLRGYSSVHPTIGELRVGELPIEVKIGDCTDDDTYYIGSVKVTEVESIIPMTKKHGDGSKSLEFDVGYGICFGHNETKAIAMSILDSCLLSPSDVPTHDEEFVLYHIDSVESTGFISHLKLPHYVTFQAELDSVRKTRKE